MGAIINSIAFPKEVPKYDYRELLGTRLQTLDVMNGKKKAQIYISTYSPTFPTRGTVIYSHANAETLQNTHYLLEFMSESLNLRFVAYDWEGYGLSEGNATEQSLKRGAECVYQYVKNQYPNDLLISWGRSIGTVAACHLAALFPSFSALILQSPMASAFNIVFEKACCGCADALENQVMITNVKCEIYLIHGTSDRIVPIKNAQLIFDNFKNQQLKQELFEVIEKTDKNVYKLLDVKQFGKMHYYIIQKGGHNDLDTVYKKQIKYIAEEMKAKLKL
ncbi:Alpha/beta_hydrolase family protein [Hexamita inflata]|uniref:Alpha/beta hydrolase family protein n=1 Tax=Hexamita inflata TaxID=28002 RepID=A0AA86NTC1_9EUKA|nr:Alpha/beta hydrolase family protein [Hexamita inflata]CAI9954129.1 Alpha/beta hydrolase family protein [Hexamita inflata]CAI9963284.1 Alpha/beta hydrolase family protein [Hexamita inflata]